MIKLTNHVPHRSLVETTRQQCPDSRFTDFIKRVTSQDNQMKNGSMETSFYTDMSAIDPSVTPTLYEHNLHSRPKNRIMAETTEDSTGALNIQQEDEDSVDYKDFPNPPPITPFIDGGPRDPCATLQPSFMHRPTSRFTEIFDLDTPMNDHHSPKKPVLTSSHSFRGLLRSLSTTSRSKSSDDRQQRWNMAALFHDVIRPRRTIKEKQASPVPSLTRSTTTTSPPSSFCSYPRLLRRSTEGDNIGVDDRHHYNIMDNNNKSQVLLEDDCYLEKQLPPLPCK